MKTVGFTYALRKSFCLTLFIPSSLPCVYCSSMCYKIYSNIPLSSWVQRRLRMKDMGILFSSSSCLFFFFFFFFSSDYSPLFNPFFPRRPLAHECQPMDFTFHIESARLSVNNALFNCFYTRMHPPSQNILRLLWKQLRQSSATV